MYIKIMQQINFMHSKSTSTCNDKIVSTYIHYVHIDNKYKILKSKKVN